VEQLTGAPFEHPPSRPLDVRVGGWFLDPPSALLAELDKKTCADATGDDAQGRRPIGHPSLLARELQLPDEQLSLMRIIEVHPLTVAWLTPPLDGDQSSRPVLVAGGVVRVDREPVE
jgi:hypothetical protein